MSSLPSLRGIRYCSRDLWSCKTDFVSSRKSASQNPLEPGFTVLMYFSHTFSQDMWRSISSCLLSLSEDPKRVEKEIDHVKHLQVNTGPMQQSQQHSSGNCSCGGTRCDLVLASTDDTANNNHERRESWLQIRYGLQFRQLG